MSIIERLEVRKQLKECRVCAWLSTLEEKARKEWAQAIADPRFSYGMIADEIRIEQEAAGYKGSSPIGESSVDTHRRRNHR